MGGAGLKIQAWQVQSHIQNASFNTIFASWEESESRNPAITGKVPPIHFFPCLWIWNGLHVIRIDTTIDTFEFDLETYLFNLQESN